MLRNFLIRSLVATVATSGSLSIAQIPGDFDRSFGAPNGYITALTSGSVIGIQRPVIAVQPDGKYLIAGACGGAVDTDFCVARINSDGTFDLSFDGPNVATPGNGKFVLQIGEGRSGATAVMVQRDGKIVVAGYCYANGRREFCVARIKGDGKLDETFDGPNTQAPGNGKFVVPPWGTLTDRLLAAAVLQADDRILLSGYCYGGQDAAFQSRICVARLNADGSFDDTFDGANVANPGNGRFGFRIGVDQNFASAVALRSDGAIVIAGTCGAATASTRYVCIAQLLANGDIDRGFIGDRRYPGESDFSMGGSSSTATAVAVQADGKIVVAGNCVVGGVNQICAARVLATGVTDNSFGHASGTLIVPMAGITATASGVVIQTDGRIIIVGTCMDGVQNRICLVRLNTDGAIDSTFDGWTGTGNGATALPALTQSDSGTSVALLNDGRILVAAQCNNDVFDILCVARLHGGPFEATRCSLDLDGDGVVSPLTDLLMMTRVARGVTGAGVTNAILFSVNATRKTWSEIHKFLTSQCGMSLVR